MRTRRFIVPALFCAMAATSARADDLFPLTRYVPSSVLYMRAGRENPKHAQVAKEWRRFFASVMESGAIEVLPALLSGAEGGDDPETDEPKEDDLTPLLRKIDWAQLIAREWVVAAGLSHGSPQAIALMRVPKPDAEKNYNAMRAVFKRIRKRSTLKIEVSEVKPEGTQVTVMAIDNEAYFAFVVQREDVLIVAFGDGLLYESLEMLTGVSKKKPLVETDRFKKALAKLPPAEDGMSFLDWAAISKALDKTLSEKAKTAPPKSPWKPWVPVARALVKDLLITDLNVSTTRTDGMREFTDTWSPLVSDAKSRGGHAILVRNKGCDPFDKFVPSDSLNFSVSSGMDISAAYKWLRKLIKDNAPDGEDVLTQLDLGLESAGVNLDRDVFSWFDGGSTFLTVSNPDPRILQEPVFILKVTDEKLAMEKLKESVEAIVKKTADPSGKGALLSLSPIKISGKDFVGVDIRDPMIRMMVPISPVVGVYHGHMIIAGSKFGAERVVSIATGDSESIRKDQARFVPQGLVPRKSDGTLVAIHFADARNRADGLQMMLRQWSMAAMLARNDPKFKDALPMLDRVSRLTSLLSPSLAGLDFFVSESECTTLDGAGWYTRSVINYRKSMRPYDGAENKDGAENGGEKEPPK